MSTIHVHAKFIEDILGTASNDKEIYSRFIGDKAPDAKSLEEEIAAVGTEEIVERSITVFPRTKDGVPFLYDYQLKGFFKDSCKMLSKLTKKDPVTGKKGKAVNESSKITSYKSVIDGLIFIRQRRIPFKFDGEITMCQRPLRASTAQGERIALASSEQIPAGAEIDFDVISKSDDLDKAVIEWLDYGYWRGVGQWRNSSKGRFCCKVTDDEGNVLFDNMKLGEEYMSA